MKRPTKNTLIALVVLPAMVLVSLAAYVLLGALPNVQLTGDQVSWLIELPILTVYAGAAVVTAATFNLAMTWEPGPHTEAGWHDRALAGDRHAKWLLIRNDLRWLALLVLFGAWYWPPG
jgi:hypothetical protein